MRSLFAPQVQVQVQVGGRAWDAGGGDKSLLSDICSWEGNRAGAMMRGRWPFPPVTSSLWDPRILPGTEQYPSTFRKV